jgi:predicted nucleic acid-binding protein
MSQDCIVDASVGVKLFVEEEDSEAAGRLFARLAADPPARFFVPDLFYVECANILWKYVRRYGYAADAARQDVADLISLNLLTVSTADLLEGALEIALTYDTTAYDSSYAALARQLGVPLITADAPLARKLSASGIQVQMLAELETQSRHENSPNGPAA